MKIKFSHNYPKLHGQQIATLLALKVVNRSDLSDEFIEYDTVYYEPDKDFPSAMVEKHYPLPPNKYLILLFWGDKYIPFTTVRRWTLKKEDYYYNNLGNTFEIEVEEK